MLTKNFLKYFNYVSAGVVVILFLLILFKGVPPALSRMLAYTAIMIIAARILLRIYSLKIQNKQKGE